MPQHLVLVDDTNPNIQYSGPWFTAQNTQPITGHNGPPFQSTLHGVNVNASLSFSFSGSSVIVLGTSITTNASGTQNPTWECFIDNNSIGGKPAAGSNVNSWVFCENSQLQDGPHVLTVNATVLNQQTFWFDQIQYFPSSNVSLDQSIVRVDSSDSAIQYSSGWGELKGIVNMTQTAGSTITYEFSGVSLTWLGFVPSNFSLTPSSAIYYIDGQPVSFFVPALSTAGALPLYNQVLFQTGQLSAGQHKLIVTHQGNSGTAPLALDYFVVQNAMSPSATSALASATSTISSSVPSGSSSDSTSNLGSKKSPPVGIIVGVVCGVTVVLLLLLLLYIRRRKHRRALELSENSYSASDSSDAVHPFTSSQPQSYTSESQSLIPQTLANKFSQRGEPTDTPSTFNNMRPTSPPTDGGRMPVLTPSQIHSSSPLVPTTSPLSYLSGAKTNSVSHATQHTEIMPLVQLSAFAQSSDPNFLQHEDSGIRMPPLAQDNRVEVPPVYTTR